MEVEGDENPLKSLVIDLTGVDPNNAFFVPYIKGATFLWHLAGIVGGACKFF